jgi:hypothetical protein
MPHPLWSTGSSLFQELGITRAHIAARMEGDWLGLITQCPERVASLSLLCPLALESRAAMQLASRMLVITGDRGASAERVQNALGIVDGAAKFTLGDYEALMWSDLAWSGRTRSAQPCWISWAVPAMTTRSHRFDCRRAKEKPQVSPTKCAARGRPWC